MIELFTDTGIQITISKSMVTIQRETSAMETYRLNESSKEMLSNILKSGQELRDTRESIAQVFTLNTQPNTERKRWK